MNKFMGGLTLGIIATAFFFIVYNPFPKKPVTPQLNNAEAAIDSSQDPGKILLKDSNLPTIPFSVKNRGQVNRDSLVLFAKSLLGIPYLYGSTDPTKGFDCSGFINYVFNHFNMTVPRSSFEFENIGIKRSLNNCMPGDVVMFTGTDPVERSIGHIGIVCENVNGISTFIHSSSGRANGVTITSMDNKFYEDRFIAVVDVLSRL